MNLPGSFLADSNSCVVSSFSVKPSTSFCGDCGSRLYGERAGRPQSMNLRAGTRDETSWVVPAAHFFMRSAQSWIQPAADARCYEVQADFAEAFSAWRAMWPEFFPLK